MSAQNSRMESILGRVNDLITGGNLKPFLTFMTRFHRLSAGNCLLIFSACPNAQKVQSYEAWKREGRQVKAGETGIPVYRPAKYFARLNVPKRDAQGSPVLDFQGKPLMEQIRKEVMAYRKEYVFDLSQTTGRDIPGLEKNKAPLPSKFEDVMKFICRAFAPLTIRLEEQSVNGYCSFENRTIHINRNLSHSRMIQTALTEVSHLALHEKSPGRQNAEIAAQTTAFMLASYLGLDTSGYAYPNMQLWSWGKNPEEILDILSCANDAAKGIIDAAEHIRMEERPSPTPPLTQAEQIEMLKKVSPPAAQKEKEGELEL